MNTPIADFLEDYDKKGMLRLHMPGHNGEAPHDITEIAGADSLYETDSSRGIIAHSEAIAAKLFGAARTRRLLPSSERRAAGPSRRGAAPTGVLFPRRRCSVWTSSGSTRRNTPPLMSTAQRKRSPARTRCSSPMSITTAAPAMRTIPAYR